MNVGTGAAIFGCSGTTLGPDEAAFYRDADPFGFILFARNIDTPGQVRRLTAALRASVGRHAPIFVDQEGGRVQRLRSPHWREWMAPLDCVSAVLATAKPGQGVAAAARAMWLRYRVIAAELHAVGIDGNCAPCLDVATDVTHPFLKNRCYAPDVASVVAYGRAVADAHLAGGVLPVVKHMPGHGRASGDTHHDLPTVTADAATLEATDFAAFRALNDLPLAMTAHIVFSAYDTQPATCSATMIKLIRESIGFQGLLMTDDIAMQALSGSHADRTAAAIKAGCDLVLHCNGDLAARVTVATAAGTMGPATLARAVAALGWRHTPEPVDIAACEAELSGLTGGNGHG
ncbi:MAG: glycoside hydrolase family 3 N-terminal domain-containing protein [Paracoccaceae bacterium]